MPALWKQTIPLHPTFAPLNRCLSEDWFLLPHELRLQRAHGQVLARAGILTAPELAALERALEQIGGQYLGRNCPESDAEDLHTWVETQLTELAGDAGRKIHTARSRNDQVATLLKLYTIAAGERLDVQLVELIRVACTQAAHWADLVMPLLTHTQYAAPGSPGFWVLRFATAFDRLRRQLAAALVEWRRYCPLGAGAVAGSSIPIDRVQQARLLGFEGPALNALDATSTRDDCLELLELATRCALHLQTLATDVVLFAQTPLAWVKYPAAFATGSSMMPNKLNPDAMELLRGESNAVAAAHAEVVGILKGLPSGYNRDLQCVKPVLHRAVQKLHMLLDLVNAFVAELDFDAERLAAAVRHGNIGATLRMEAQVLAGLPLREAHHAVATEVRAANDPAAPEIAEPLGRYRTAGSANPGEVRRVAAELLERNRGPGKSGTGA
jgi:argininosuccinate lyase